MVQNVRIQNVLLLTSFLWMYKGLFCITFPLHCSHFIVFGSISLPLAVDLPCSLPNPTLTLQMYGVYSSGRGTPKVGGGGGLQGCKPTKPPKLKFKNHRFCRYYDIKSVMLFPLQSKSAIEIGR
jgi:hypothetical protein